MKRPTIVFKLVTIAAAAILIGLTAGCGGGGGSDGRGGTNVPPVINLTSPTPLAEITDTTFAADDFYVQFSYASENQDQMRLETLAVTMKLDSGTAQNITSYFQKVDDSTIKSVNLDSYILNMYEWPTNTATHTITIVASIKDYHYNLGATTTTFIVKPVEDAPPPPSVP